MKLSDLPQFGKITDGAKYLPSITPESEKHGEKLIFDDFRNTASRLGVKRSQHQLQYLGSAPPVGFWRIDRRCENCGIFFSMLGLG